MKNDKTVETVEKTSRYTKEQIVKSKKYKNNADLINTILVDNREYSLNEVDEKIQKVLKTVVSG